MYVCMYVRTYVCTQDTMLPSMLGWHAVSISSVPNAVRNSLFQEAGFKVSLFSCMDTGTSRHATCEIRVCARTQRTGAAAREPLRQDRPGGLTSPVAVAAAPVLFAHAVVTVAQNM